VKNVAESAMREIVGQTAFELARTQGRATIQQRTLELMQKILDSYGAGILSPRSRCRRSIRPRTPSRPSATSRRRVPTRSARSTRRRPTTTEVTNKAEGEAQRIIKNGEGYKAEKIAIAKGRRRALHLGLRPVPAVEGH